MTTRPVLGAQAVYYLATSVWPMVSPGTFQAVTGPKADMWLVKTFGVLVGVVGLTLGYAVVRGRDQSEIRVLAISSAAGLGAADAWYVARGRIRKTYLIDAAAQAALLAALIAGSAASGSETQDEAAG